MKVSFICAVYGVNKLAELRRMIASVERQDLEVYELIIVDQNSCDTIKDLIEQFDNPRIVHLRSQPGLAKARNVGLRNVRYEWVCFPDDDCFYPSHFFEKLKAFTSVSNFLLVNVRDVDELSDTNFTRRKISGFLKKDEIFYNGCSISIVLKANSNILFDERFGLGGRYNSCEDYDYCLQHYINTGELYFVRDCFVCHPANRDIEFVHLLNKIENNSIGHGAFFAKWLFFFRFQAIKQVFGHLLLAMFYVLDVEKRLKYITSFKSRIKGFYDYAKESISIIRA